MARSRNIKPGLFKNEVLGEADPLLTILFQGLWCLADREGRLEDRPRRIKAEIFPYRELPDFNGYLTELARLGFIDRYVVENVAVIQVNSFKKHQSPHKTEKASELPEKPIETDSCRSTQQAPLNNETLTDEAALIPDSLNTDSLIPNKQTNQGESNEIHPDEKIGIHWRPPDWVMERLDTLGIPKDFIEYKITEFIAYWQSQEPQTEYNNRFVKSANRDWQHQRHEWGKDHAHKTRPRQPGSVSQLTPAQQLRQEIAASRGSS